MSQQRAFTHLTSLQRSPGKALRATSGAPSPIGSEARWRVQACDRARPVAAGEESLDTSEEVAGQGRPQRRRRYPEPASALDAVIAAKQ